MTNAARIRWILFLGCPIQLCLWISECLADPPVAQPRKPLEAIAPGSDETDRPSAAAGWFHLGQRDGRDVLLSPGEEVLFAFGVNHIGNIRSTAYFQSLPEPAEQRWETVLNDYRETGFTVAGFGCPAEFSQAMPYFLGGSTSRTSKYLSIPPAATGPEKHQTWNFPDVWSDDWKREARADIESLCARSADDPLLIGYFWTDTPTWDLSKTRGLRGTEWVSTIRNLPAGTPGKQQYLAFLQETYTGRIDEFREFYNLAINSLDELASVDLQHVPVGRHRVLADDRRFLGRIAEKYYETLAALQQEIDPHHLRFGERYLLGDTPDEVLLAARNHVDVISLQPGDGYTDLYPASDLFPDEELDRIRRLTGKPILICDHQISFPTAEYALTTWTQLDDEAEAAAATGEFLLATLKRTDVIGYLRCQYVDQPAGLGRGMKQGLIRQDGQFHPRMRQVHMTAGQQVRQFPEHPPDSVEKR